MTSLAEWQQHWRQRLRQGLNKPVLLPVSHKLHHSMICLLNHALAWNLNPYWKSSSGTWRLCLVTLGRPGRPRVAQGHSSEPNLT